MNEDTVLELGRNAMYITLLVSAPMLLSGMVIGLIISVFQSVTQIQEITLTFVPKIVVVMAAFILFMPWMLSMLLQYVQPLFGGFVAIVR
jgi:flagellar biosynthesis protein FliQ